MNQRTHAWIAVRTIALLEDSGKAKNLVKLLKPHAGKAAIGAWIPDLQDSKRGGSKTENHIFKIKPYKGNLKDRFIADKKETLKRLGNARLMTDYINNDNTLKSTWWGKPYKGDIDKPGQHLANRAMAMSVMMLDLLLMGEDTVDKLLPGTVSFAKQIDKNAKTQAEQVALYFFMLSHFVADSCMPCHCDARKLASYSNSLHKEMEMAWSKLVGTKFSKNKLLPANMSVSPDEILKESRKVDQKFGIKFKANAIGKLVAGDIWLEIINICRGSFAVNSILAPPSKYKYGDNSARAPFNKVFGDANSQEFNDLSRMVMHDAVLNNAIIWRQIWDKASKF
ncbi:MAG: hypothetical protein JW715_02720 [Sedimentisphaerales bacterium]|nr:hypothetical protein [Sedimentisphaerales bacterium]